MAAAAGATGVRSWLQTRHLTWLTPRRLRAVTIAVMILAFGVSTVGLGGASQPVKPSSHSAGQLP
jgi:hypothetical protein